MSWAVWITGSAASDTTTVARAAAKLLQARGEPVRVLEHGIIRSRLVPDAEHTETEHELVGRALVYVAAKLSEARIPVIVEMSGACRNWRELARDATPHRAEVRLRCSPAIDESHESALAPELTIDATNGEVAAASVASLAEDLACAAAPAGREHGARWAIWITGRPGSGKTTLARRVAALLAAESERLVVLDLAAARRTVVGREWATNHQEALVYRTLALTAQLLTEAGVAVILDATAPRRAWREVAREWIAHFAEVQLVCPSEICEARERATRWHLGDARFESGPATLLEVALDYEESWHPELRLHTDSPDLEASIEEVLQLARRLERAVTSGAGDKEGASHESA